MERFFDSINVSLWGSLIPVMLIGIGVFLTVRSGFLQFRRLPQMLSATIGSLFLKKGKQGEQSLSVWHSVSTALASTIGTGSIVGVAAALKFGGPGAVFWMWISALLGMVIKYAEVALAVRYRRKNAEMNIFGGPMYYLQNGLGSVFLSAFFSVFCICACFGMGNMVQANAIAVSLKNQFCANSFWVGVILLFLVTIVIFGGCQRIAKTNAGLVPVMCLVYVSCCIIIIFMRMDTLPKVFYKIFQEAFSLPAAAGGVSSYGFFSAMRNGFSKGIFSSEAGLGSAPLAHGSSDSGNEEEHGFWGMFEVLFTTLICTMTALVILTSDSFVMPSLSAEALTLISFEEALPNFGGFVVCISTLLFSLSTILGWAFYGEICIDFLFPGKKSFRLLFRICYVISVFFGAIGTMQKIWLFSELSNALMMIPNLIGIAFLANRLFSCEKRYLTPDIKNNP